MLDPDPAISGAGSVLAGSRSGLRFKRHGHGSVQALLSGRLLLLNLALLIGIDVLVLLVPLKETQRPNVM